ncbi:hypothetical protein [[Clostridium] fimetarium]|uniref:hypothetical protein n=1 Tax=[Clostridium] fimetarium TaxID=99656 RepID=UPI000B86EAAC|nr:hypothetical protein [[Clostridium] fimetarium]
MQIEELEERKLKICNGIGDREERKILEQKMSDLIGKCKNVLSIHKTESKSNGNIKLNLKIC